MLDKTGERLLPWDLQYPQNHYEHLQRYYFAAKFATGRKVLDLGSGEGYGADILALVANETTGVDISPEAVDWANQKYRRPGLTYVCGSATEIPIPCESAFDLVVCFEMIEHIADHHALLREVKRLLKPEGLLIISTPNKAVYSDAPHYQNPFHVRELYVSEFQQLIGNYFPYASYMGQRAHPGAAMWPLEGRATGADEVVVQRAEGSFVAVENTSKVPMYILALASEQPLSVEVQGLNSRFFFLLDISDTLITRLCEDFEARSQVLSTELAERNDALASLKASLSWKVTAPARWLTTCARTLLHKLQTIRYARMVGRSGLFDLNYYRSQNQDLAKTGMNPLVHYLVRGGNEWLDPHALFDSSYYLLQNPDVAKRGMNPLVHYLIHGGSEGRDPHPLFDSSYYLSQNPDVAKAGMNPLAHYVLYGAYDGRDPYPHFDSGYYLKRYPDVAGARINPLVHYLGPGVAEGCDPNPSFDTSAYLEANPEVALKGLNPLIHFATCPATTPPAVRRRDSNNQADSVHAGTSEGNNTPMFSVLVPVYNHVKYVRQAVMSALRSPLVSEVLLVDDGSSDGSAGILAELAANNPARVRNLTKQGEGNRGAPSRLNELVAAATCNWMAVLNSDDVFVNDRLEAIVDAGDFSESDFVFGNLLLIDGAGSLVSAKRGPFDGTPFPREFDVEEMVGNGNWIDLLAHQNYLGTTSNMVFTKALHARIGGFSAFRYVHDWDFALRAMASGRCLYVPHYFTAYRVHANNTIKENSAKVEAESQALFDKLLLDFPQLAERSHFRIGLTQNVVCKR